MFYCQYSSEIIAYPQKLEGFSDSSVGKEFTCNAADPGSIPGSGRSSRERTGYPLQYSWTSPVAQLIKNPSAMRETWVQSLGWEDPPEKGKSTHSVFSGEFDGVTKNRTQLSDFPFHFQRKTSYKNQLHKISIISYLSHVIICNSSFSHYLLFFLVITFIS